MKLTLAILAVFLLLQLFACVNAFSRVKREDPIEADLVEVDNKSITLGADSVDAINSRTRLFTARRYPRFEGLSNDELSSFLGAKSNAETLAVIASDQNLQAKTIGDPVATLPPASFDVSQKWPQCKKVFESIQDQSTCFSGWAVSSASVISDRRCIVYNGTAGARISAWDLATCCANCQASPDSGCTMGYPIRAMQYYRDVGIVTGGSYGGGGCKPYFLAPGAPTLPWSTTCTQTCQSSYTINSYANDRKKGINPMFILLDNAAVQNELMKQGPVVAQFTVYQDFYQYSSGIYHHVTGSLVNYHAVKIHGWGEENGVKYWKVANSWGPSWGENGFFRIRRDNNECGIEEMITFAKALRD